MIQFFRRAVLAISIAVGFGLSASAASSIEIPVSNAGFEGPLSTASGNGNWFRFFGFNATSAQDQTMPRTGNSALRLGINNQAATFAGVFQDFAVDPGDILDLSYFAKTGLEPSGFESRIEFLDQNGGQISQFINNFTPVLGPEYTEYSLSDGATAATRTAPGNATTARVVFAVQSFVGPNSQVVFVDDVSLFDVTSVPLPAPLLLLGSVLLGGLGVSRYRRSAAKSN